MTARRMLYGLQLLIGSVYGAIFMAGSSLLLRRADLVVEASAFGAASGLILAVVVYGGRPS